MHISLTGSIDWKFFPNDFEHNATKIQNEFCEREKNNGVFMLNIFKRCLWFWGTPRKGWSLIVIKIHGEKNKDTDELKLEPGNAQNARSDIAVDRCLVSYF